MCYSLNFTSRDQAGGQPLSKSGATADELTSPHH